VHWSQAVLPPGARPLVADEDAAGAIRWTDPVDGTVWTMDPAAFRQACAAACRELPDADPTAVPSPGSNLPWLEAGDRPWRLSDQAHVFAALYFCVSPTAQACWTTERRKARRAALGPETNLRALVDPAAAAACLAALRGRDDAELGTYCFDIVRGGAVRVQQYVLESAWLPGIRGASALLTRAEERLPQCLPEPDCLLVAGGSHFLAVVPAGCGAAVAADVERMFQAVTVSGRAVAAAVPASLAAVRRAGYRRVQQRLEFALALRQQTLLPERVEGGPADLEGGLDQESGLAALSGPARDCTRCGWRRAQYRDTTAAEEQRLCPSCARKRLESREETSGLRARFHAATGRRLASVQSLEDLGAPAGRNGGEYIGLLAGDGNGLGRLVSQLQSLPALRCFSQRLAEAAEQAVFHAVADLVPERRAELVVLGGDDLRLFVPGPVAWTVANAIATHFESAFRNRSRGDAAVTLAIGVAISHTKTPLTMMQAAVHDLLRSAKCRSKQDPQRMQSAVDLAVLDSFTGFADSVDAFRAETLHRSGPPEVELCSRPFTLAQSKKLADIVAQIGTLGRGAVARRTQIHRLADALQEAIPAEADLFLGYQLARGDPEWRRRLRAILTELAGLVAEGPVDARQPPSLFTQARDGTLRSAWLDLVELLDFAAGTPLEAQRQGNGKVGIVADGR
jgi:hypothetical protein